MAEIFLKKTLRCLLVAYFTCTAGTYAFAANELAQTFTLDGQLMLAGTTTVLSDSAAVLKIDILDPSKACVLYEETQTVNTVSSDGYFSIQVGSVTGASKRTSSDPGLTMVQIFQNTSAVTATSASGSTCAGNTYTPSADAVRYFRITVTPSSTNVADVLSPDTTIDAAPMAMVAQSLQGYAATDFLAKAGLPTCSSGTFLTYDGTNMTCAAVSGSSGGTVTSITAGTGLTGGTITASGTLALATSGATAGTYGSASAVPVVTVDTYGRVTTITTASISSAPSGAASGDLSGTYPGPTVNGLSGTALSISSLTSGQYLKYNGTNWINSTLSVSDSNITYASEAANTFFAAPNGSAGTPTFRAMVAADLPTVPYTRGGTGLTATPANGQIPIGNGAGYTLGTLTAGTGITVTNTAGTVTIAASGGTGTVTSVSGTAPISVATGTSTPVVSISQATSSTSGYLSSTDWTTFNSKMSSTLASGDIFVGNASGAATAVAMSGDATLSSTGVLTLASVATVGTYEKVIVNAKGLVTSGSSLGSSDITTALGYTPVNKAGDSMTGNLTFASGDGTIYTAANSNTVTVEAPSSVTTSYVLKLPAAVASAAGQVLTSDTSGNLSWSTPTTTATSYSGVLPIANGGTNSSTALTGNQVMVSTTAGKIAEGGAMANGQVMIGSGSGAPVAATLTAGTGITITNAANSITIASSGSSMPSLPSADIFVGNSSGGAAAVAMSGDIGITNAGATTVNKIQGTTVSSTTPTAGQVLRYTSGTGWVPDFVSMADLRSTITGATALTSCGANQTLTWTAAADNLTCTSIAISDSQITYGSETANTVLAAPNGSAGVPTYRALVAADLPTVPYTRGGTGLTATPTNGQIPIGNGAGYTLGTLTAGSGVTITNTAGVISIAATTGGGGTVTSVTGTAPISVATGTTTPAITIAQSTTSTDGYLSSTDWNTFNSKMSSGLASGDIFVGNASGAAAAVAMSGDATLSNAGVLTLASVATVGTYEKVIVNAKGLVTSGSSLGSSDITTALGYTPVNKAGDSMTGSLTFASTKGTVYTDSGSNTVTVEAPTTISTSYVLKLPTAVASAAGQVLTSDTSGNLSWSTPTTTATSYSGVLPIANGGTNSSTALTGNQVMVSTTAGKIVEGGAMANGQVMIGSGSGAPVAATLTAGTGVTITNAAGGITIAASGSGGTVTSVTGTAPISVATGTTTPAISITQATTSTSGYLSSTDWNTFNSKLTSSLASGDIFVGNASSAAIPVAMSGDATLSSAGALTLATVATAGTYEKLVVNAKGLVTSGSSLGSSDITTALGYTPVNKAGDSMTGNLTFASGDGTIYTAANSNTVTVEAPASVTTSYVLKLPAAVASAAGQVLTSDTSGNLSWSTPTTTATSYSGILPIANGGTNSSTGLTGNQVMVSTTAGKIVEGGAMANGQVMIGSGSGAPVAATLTAGTGITITNAANSITIASSGSSMPSLPSADIFVGNSSGGAAAVAMSGDIGITNAGATTVNKIQGTTVSSTTPTAGQVLRYTSGTGWVPDFVSMADLRSTITGATALTSCGANQTLTWTAAADNLTCTSIAISDSQITYGSETANTVLAAPNGSAGVPTYRALASADLPTVPYSKGGTGLTAAPTNGQIPIGNGSGYTLGTLTAGSGITVTNTAGVITIASSAGSGTVTSVTGTAPISVATGTTTPAITIAQATTSTAGYLSSTDWNTFNSKIGSSLTSGDIFVGNSSGAAVPVALSGDATLSNAGVLTLASVATAGTYEKVVVNAKGLVTSGSSLGSTDITTALGYTPVNKAGDSMSGNLTFASTTGTVYTDSSSNTVTVEAPSTISSSYVLRLPAAVASATGQVLTSDTSGNLSWTTLLASFYSGTLYVAGHIADSATGAPSTGTTCGVSLSMTGNDTRGTITLASAPTAQCTVTITFATAYDSAPYCVLTAVTGGTGVSSPGINSASATALIVDLFAATAAGRAVANGSYPTVFNYMCLQ